MIGVILDLDDTCLGTSPVYDAIIFEALKTITEDLNPLHIKPEDMFAIFDLMHWQDPTNDTHLANLDEADEIMRSPYRFPKSLVKVYVECCLRVGKFPEQEIADKLYKMGMKIFTSDYKLLPGAKRCIDYLNRSNNFTLFLITLGEQELQVPKIKAKKMFLNFERIMVCPFDTNKGSVIKNLREEYDNIDRWVMVGDSISVDINPALACGIDAFHVTLNQGAHSRGDLIAVGDRLKRYREFKDLTEVREYLEEISKNDRKISV